MPNNNPLTTYHFTADWGGSRVSFTEVSGLDITTEVVHHREGGSPQYNDKLMPGRIKYGNLVFKRGIIAGDNDFYQWINTINLNTVERRDITVCLLDEYHQPVVMWRVKNAFPVKYTSPILLATENNIAIETLEIAHEGFTMEHAG